MDYQENLRQKAEELARDRYPETFRLSEEDEPEPGAPRWWQNHYYKSQRAYVTRQMLPIAAKALEWAAETAHAVNGPQMSKTIIDAMLQELGVIPKT